MRTAGKVRVLVIDDSALMRKMITQILQRDETLEVVGTAIDGSFGLKKIEELRPDVVTLDLEMPRMDGMETLRQITRSHKIPVIIVSSHSTTGASATFKALSLGAFDFVSKPRDSGQLHLQAISSELIAKIKVAAGSGSIKPELTGLGGGNGSGIIRRPAKPPLSKSAPTRLVAIGISTGGPNALQYLLAQLPGDFPGSIVVVQHMPEGFTEMFARRLDDTCAIHVKEAQSGDVLAAGRALICPGNRHLKVKRMPLGAVAILSDEPAVNGHRPSVEVMFRSVAQEFASNALAVIMTGMGDDGADAMGVVKAAGGLTIAQSEESCVVFGMPKAAIDKGHVQRVVPLDTLANTLQAQCLAPEWTRAAKV